MDNKGFIKPSDLSIGLNSVWIVEEEFVDDRISSDFIHHFSKEIPLDNGIIRNPKNGNFILNPTVENSDDSYKGSYEVSSDFTGLFLEKRDCEMTAAALNDKEFKKAEKMYDELLAKADTLQETIIKFYEERKKFN